MEVKIDFDNKKLRTYWYLTVSNTISKYVECYNKRLITKIKIYNIKLKDKEIRKTIVSIYSDLSVHLVL